MSDSWIFIGTEPKEDLQHLCQRRFAGMVEKYQLTPAQIACVTDLDRSLIQGDLKVTDAQLEHLRKLAQLHAVELRAQTISSHRKFVGPLIVAAKKALFPIIRMFLKDILRDQRAFNALVVASLAELYTQQYASRAGQGAVNAQGASHQK